MWLKSTSIFLSRNWEINEMKSVKPRTPSQSYLQHKWTVDLRLEYCFHEALVPLDSLERHHIIYLKFLKQYLYIYLFVGTCAYARVCLCTCECVCAPTQHVSLKVGKQLKGVDSLLTFESWWSSSGCLDWWHVPLIQPTFSSFWVVRI